jgi:hypothetical protein
LQAFQLNDADNGGSGLAPGNENDAFVSIRYAVDEIAKMLSQRRHCYLVVSHIASAIAPGSFKSYDSSES